MNAYCTVLFIIFDSIIAEIINDFIQNRTHAVQHRFIPVNIKMNVFLISNLFQSATHISDNLTHIQLFPVIRSFSLIKLRYTDRILDQRDQTLGFIINSACKFLYIFLSDQSVSNNLCKTGYCSQRRHQLMRNIGRKFSAQLFAFHLFCFVDQQKYCTYHPLFSGNRVRDHLNDFAAQTQTYTSVFSTQNLFDHKAEFFTTVQQINAFPNLWFLHLKHFPCTGISRQDHCITVDHKEPFLHIFCNDRKLFLISSGCFQLTSDLSVLLIYLT